MSGDTKDTVILALESAKLILDFIQEVQDMSAEAARVEWAKLQSRLKEANALWEAGES